MVCCLLWFGYDAVGGAHCGVAWVLLLLRFAWFVGWLIVLVFYFKVVCVYVL